MKNKIKIVLFLLIAIVLINLSSCKKEFELYRQEGDEFALEESLYVLKKNGWEQREKKYTMEEITQQMINVCSRKDSSFSINLMKNYIYLKAPNRLQNKENYEYYVSFYEFDSNDDAEKYYAIECYEADNYGKRGFNISIDNNVVVITDSQEAMELIPLEFIIV